MEYRIARSIASQPPPSPKAATITRVYPNTCWAWVSPRPSTPPTRFSTGTTTSSRNNAAVFDSRMPCLSSGGAEDSPAVPRSTRNHDGPPGAIASTVYASAMLPLLIHCLRPVMR